MTSWRAWCKAGVSLLCIGILFFLYGSSDVFTSIQRLSWHHIALLTLFCTASLSLLASRFKYILSTKNITGSWTSFFSLQLMGLTISQFLPGLYGGDVLRAAYFMERFKTEKRFLTAAVLFERISGFMAMLMVGAVTSLIVYHSNKKEEWLLFFFIIVCIFGTFCLFFNKISSDKKAHIKGLLQVSRDIISQLKSLQSQTGILSTTLLYSLASQFFSILSYYYLLGIMQSALPFYEVAAVATLGWLVTLLPISLNGLGVKESGIIAGLISLGVPKTTALAVALIGFLPTLLHAMLGGILIGYNFQSIMGLKKLFAKTKP